MDGQDRRTFPAQDDIITRVVTELALTLNRDATDIRPLAHAINPDGVRQLVESTESCTLSFSHAGCVVRIRVSGEEPTVDVNRAAK